MTMPPAALNAAVETADLLARKSRSGSIGCSSDVKTVKYQNMKNPLTNLCIYNRIKTRDTLSHKMVSKPGGIYMNVTYIEHSSFLVELKQCYLLFDYYQGEIKELNPDLELYVFVSHRHGDHFSDAIFELAKDYPRIHYIISDDVWKGKVPEVLQKKTLFIGPDKDETVGGVRVITYRSTDEGVAFLLEAEGWRIYHGGDLNHWYWSGEPDYWNRQMGENYRKELDKLNGQRVDVAFLPVDPRLSEFYCLGADEFMKQVGAKVVFPMHFWGDYQVGARWKAEVCAKDYRDRIMEIHEQGECFSLDF